jgi:hypothetical protein
MKTMMTTNGWASSFLLLSDNKTSAVCDHDSRGTTPDARANISLRLFYLNF